MIRMTIVCSFLLFLWVYAFKDWMVSLCGLILLTVLLQKSELPAFLEGVQGLNAWNLTLVIITLCWLVQRNRDARPWNLSPLAIGIGAGYFAIIIVAYVQALMDANSFPPGVLTPTTTRYLTVDHLINPLKFLWVALLMVDGCHSRRRLVLAVGALIALGVLYGAMVVKTMPLTSLLDAGGILKLRHRIDKQVGLHANDMAKVLVITFWSIVATQRLWWRTWWLKAAVVVGCSVTFLGMVLCYSRAGYVTFVAVGFVLGCIRWRKLLLVGPPVMLVLAFCMPSVTERILMGFDQPAGVQGGGGMNWNEITAGRTGNLWPPILEEIQKSPLLGHGRLAILHTAAYDKIMASEGGVPTTPHNGYLEVMVDMGAIGLLIVLSLFIGVGVMSFQLVRLHQDILLTAVGGLGLAHVVGCLVNALSGGVLLPHQGMLGTLCVLGIVARVWSCRRMGYYAPAARPLERAVQSDWPFSAPQRQQTGISRI